jgi:hypothetical protein
MEGVRLLADHEVQSLNIEERKKLAEVDLKEILSGLARNLFGDVQMRYVISTYHV